MLKIYFTLAGLLISSLVYSQSYISYFTGETADVTTPTQPVTVLMGGAGESDEAMTWFLQHTGGGDIVVLRTSGADGYNTYLYSELGVTVNSVETILCNDASASYDPYVVNQVLNAEGLWFAGGNQATYMAFWKDTPMDTAINYLINVKKVPIGGLSAGMAIQGSIVYTGENGSVVSPAALLNPYNIDVTLSNDEFLHNPWLQDVVTDTHYNDPDRRGRHVTFLARIAQDYGVTAYGIACNEYTAVCIDTDGRATVYGDYPNYEDFAYFIQVNCFLPNTPEVCASGQPLTWNRNQQALKTYKVPGTLNGSNSFLLSDWTTGSGGTWEHWYVNNGQFTDVPNVLPEPCNGTSINDDFSKNLLLKCYPNPVVNYLTVELLMETTLNNCTLSLLNAQGQLIEQIQPKQHTIVFDTRLLSSGIYTLKYTSDKMNAVYKIVKE